MHPSQFDPCAHSGDLRASKRRKRLLVSLLIVPICIGAIGCQGLGWRRGEGANSFASDDDWSIPSSPPTSSLVPRPSPYARHRAAETAAPPATESSAAAKPEAASAPTPPSPPPAAPQTPPPVSKGPVRASLSDHDEAEGAVTAAEPIQEEATDSAASSEKKETEKKETEKVTAQVSDSDALNVIDVGEEEIDLEGALAGLPAPYRDFLRKQLQTTQDHDSSPSEDKGSIEVVSNKGVIPPSDPLKSEVLLASASSPLSPKIEGIDSNESLSAESLDSVRNGSTWNQTLSQAIQQLESQLKDAPAEDENLRLHREIAYRLLLVSSRRLEDALKPISGMSELENLYMQHQMQALFELSNPDAMPVRSRHLSLVMNSQRQASNYLAAVSNLEVRSTSFCTDVERYGVVTKFPRYQFVQDQEVLLYCEIENVAAKPVRGGFETQLQGSYEIVDGNGNRVSEQILPMEPDFCENHRRDYFIVYKIFMPQQIAPGNYKLRLTIEDMNARKFGQSTLDFQIKK